MNWREKEERAMIPLECFTRKTKLMKASSLVTQGIKAISFSLLLIFMGPSAGYSQEPVVAVYGGISGQQAPLWLTSDLGLFAKYGLDVQPIFVRGGAIWTAGISAGEIQFGVDSSVSPITAAASGADIVLVGSYYNKHPWSFAVRPGIKSPQELPGKKVGVLSLGASNHMAVVTALRYWGIEEKSVTIVRAGSTSARLLALRSGQIDATVLVSPETERARKIGIPILLELAQIGESFPTVSVITTRRFLASKTTVAKKFLQALNEGVYVFTKDRQKALKTLAKWMRTEDREVLEDAYTSHVRNMNFPTVIDKSGVQAVLDFLSRSRPELKAKNASEFIDDTIFRELEQEGFFNRVRGEALR